MSMQFSCSVYLQARPYQNEMTDLYTSGNACVEPIILTPACVHINNIATLDQT